MSGTRRSLAAAVTIGALAGGLGAAVPASAAEVLTARLSGAQEVPTEGQGRGTARLSLQPNRERICYRIRLRGTGRVADGHIHRGRRGVAGDVVVPLFSGANSTRLRGCADATRAQIRAIMRRPGRYYVNVHNEEFPAGVARGQLRRP